VWGRNHVGLLWSQSEANRMNRSTAGDRYGRNTTSQDMVSAPFM